MSYAVCAVAMSRLRTSAAMVAIKPMTSFTTSLLSASLCCEGSLGCRSDAHERTHRRRAQIRSSRWHYGTHRIAGFASRLACGPRAGRRTRDAVATCKSTGPRNVSAWPVRDDDHAGRTEDAAFTANRVACPLAGPLARQYIWPRPACPSRRHDFASIAVRKRCACENPAQVNYYSDLRHPRQGRRCLADCPPRDFCALDRSSVLDPRLIASSVACPDCDLLQRIPPLPPGGKAHCPRCGYHAGQAAGRTHAICRSRSRSRPCIVFHRRQHFASDGSLGRRAHREHDHCRRRLPDVAAGGANHRRAGWRFAR